MDHIYYIYYDDLYLKNLLKYRIKKHQKTHLAYLLSEFNEKDIKLLKVILLPDHRRHNIFNGIK